MSAFSTLSRGNIVRHSIAIAAAIAVTTFSVILDTRREMTVDDQKLQALVESIADSLDGQLQAWRMALSAMSVSTALDYPYDIDAFSKEAKQFANLTDTNIAFYRAEDNGLILLSHTRAVEGSLPKYYRKEDISIFYNTMQQVQETGIPSVSNLFLGPIVGEYIASMIISKTGKPNSPELLSLNFSSQELSDILQRIKLPAGYIIGVVDRNGIIGARSETASDFVGKKIPDWYQNYMSQNESGFAEGSSVSGAQYNRYRFVFTHLKEANGWAVSLLVPPKSFPFATFGFSSFVIGILSLAIANAVAWLFGTTERQRADLEKQYQKLAHQLLDELPGAVLRVRLNRDDTLVEQLSFGKLSHELHINDSVRFESEIIAKLKSRAAAAQPGPSLEFDIKEENKIYRFFAIEAAEHGSDFQDFNLYILDITNQRSAEAVAISSARLAALGQMAATLAHEMSQPINVISLAADNADSLIEDRDFIGLSAKIQKIRDFSGKSRYLIDNLLSFARGDKEDDPPVGVDLYRAIMLAQDLTHQLMTREKVQLSIQCSDHQLFVLGRPIELENIFVNLFVNSIDAFRQGNSIGQREVTVTVTPSEDSVEILVSDNAGGIPEHLLPRIFEPFVTTKSQGHGTGLGLAFVSGHIRAWGGSIAVHNSERGAIFQLRLRKASTGHDWHGTRPKTDLQSV